MNAARLGRPDLRIWIGGAALALALHASFALKLLQWHDPIPGDDGTDAVYINLAPLEQQPQSQTKQDLAPGPEQQEAPALPEPPKEEPKQQTEERIEPLPTVPTAEAVLPKPEKKRVEKKIESTRPPAPMTTAPPRPRPSAARIATWHRQIALALQRHKSYPAAARERHETGAATVAFTIDRQGRVISSRIVRSSHYAALDAETLATVHHAAPFPPPPDDLFGQSFDFVVPIQFNIK